MLSVWLFRMIASTMKSKLSIFFKFFIPPLFWLGIWQILAIIVDHKFLLPDIPATFNALISLITTTSFYKAVIFSAIRVTIGLALGCFVGIVLAVLCQHFHIVKILTSPIITVIKSTPVASFIVVLWVMLSGDVLSVFIGFLMVMPIIWQNVSNGFDAIDKSLLEVCEVFEFSYAKRFKILIFPTLKNFLIPGVITASGLAWKAEIAAEVIAYTKNSIGQGINDAKYNMDTPTVFAWTAVIIIFSILLEKLTKKLLRRVEK